MAELSQKLHVKNGSIIQEVTLYSTPEEATPTNGSYGEITFNGVTGYVALWDKSIPGGDNHTPVTVKKNNVEYWLDCIVAISNTRILTLPATEHQTITLNYTDPEDETMQTITSTDTAQEITVKYGTTWTATVAAAIGYTAGTLSASSGTVTDDVELTITEATIITFDLTLAATENQTITLTYTEPDKEAQTVTSTNTAQIITVGYGTTWTATVTAAEGYNVGTLSASSGTVTDNITISVTEAKVLLNLISYAVNHIADYQNVATLPQTNVEELTNITPTENAGSAFRNCSSLTSLSDVEQTWDTSNVTSMNNMFYSCSALASLDVSNWNTSNVTDMGYMFAYCDALIPLGVSSWNTSSVDNMNYMFAYCYALTSLDLSSWNTSNVTNMDHMFYNCTTLASLDVSDWNTSSVTNMNSTFSTCHALTSLDVSSWNISNATNMYGAFYDCRALTSLDLSNWNISNATNIGAMFTYCYALTSLDLSNWDTSNVTNMNSTFYSCDRLQYLIIGSSTFKFQLLTDNGLNNTCKILVPQALISTYQAAANWSDHASQFDAIENYTITRSNGQVTVTPNT